MHKSYAVVLRAIQLECIFLQHIMKNTGNALAGVENILWETSLPRLFFGKLKSLTPLIGTLSTITVNKDGLGLQSSVTSMEKN